MRLALLLLACPLLACTSGPAPPPAVVSAPTERVVLDVREPEAFARGHADGAINIQLGWDQLEARIRAYVPDAGTPLALVADGEGALREARAILARSGYEDVAVLDAPEDDATLRLCTAAELRSRLREPDPPIVIDVRSRSEYAQGTIDGALLFEQDEAPALLDGLDPDADYAIICEGGWRSSQLASLMRRRGFERVCNVIDGMAGWRALPPVK